MMNLGQIAWAQAHDRVVAAQDGDWCATGAGRERGNGAIMNGEDATRNYSRAARILVISADEGAAGLAGDYAAQGARLIGVVTPQLAADRIDAALGVDVIWVEAGDGPLPEMLLAKLQLLARQHLAHIIWVGAGPALDQGFAALGEDHSAADLLSAPDLGQRAAALALAIARKQHVFHDSTHDDSSRIHQLTQEVNRIARMLTELSTMGRYEGNGYAGTSYAAGGMLSAGTEAMPASFLNAPERTYTSAPDIAGYSHDGTPPYSLTAADVRHVIRLRRLRDQFFTPDMFADPAWDMLLDLMAARLSDQPVSVSSLCIAAAVPATTALRWIRTMTEQGIFERRADPDDGRRVFIALSDEAAAAMQHYFQAAQIRAAPPVHRA